MDSPKLWVLDLAVSKEVPLCYTLPEVVYEQFMLQMFDSEGSK